MVHKGSSSILILSFSERFSHSSTNFTGSWKREREIGGGRRGGGVTYADLGSPIDWLSQT